jgi:hypothetical protein
METIRAESLVLLTIVFVTATNIACGMGEAASPEEDRADRQSHEALLRVSDFPGGWQVLQRDTFSEELSLFPNTDACKGQYELSASILDFRKALLGRAQIQMGLRTVSRTQGFQIEEWVEIYDSEANAAELLRTMRAYLTDKSVQCWQDQLSERGSASKFGVTSPKGQPPQDGVVLASLRDNSTPSKSDKIYYEHYYWVVGNTGITLVITGVDEEITPELAGVAIAKAQEGITRARNVR